MVLGPNTLVGLATLAPGADKSTLVARLVPAYVDLLEQLKARWGRDLAVPLLSLRSIFKLVGTGGGSAMLYGTGFVLSV